MRKSTYSFFLNMGSLFGFVPWINLTKCELVDTKIFKIYPGAISTGIFLIYLFNQETLKHVISEIPNFLSMFGTFCLCIYSVYIKRNSWKEWIKLYIKINEIVKCNLQENLDLRWKSFAIYVFYIILLTSNRTIIYFSNWEQNIFIMDLLLYKMLAMEYFIILFALILKRGFKLLNESSLYLNYESGLKLNIIANMNREKTIRCLNLYKYLYKMVVCFNDLFGWIHISSLLLFLGIVLICMQKVVLSVMHAKLDSRASVLYSVILSNRLVSKYIFIYNYEQFSIFST